MPRQKRETNPAAALAEAASANRNQLSALAAVGERFTAAGWRPAAEVLVPVRAVPTIFPQYDAITRVAGHPTDRITLVHGPSNNGKTEFAIGLMLSYLLRGHFASLVDAEQTTPVTWLKQLMREWHAHPAFRALRPATNEYEEVVDMVERWATTIGDAKAKGELPADTTGILVVDSLRKLVPKRLLETMLKEGAGDDEAKGAGGRKKKPGGVDGMAGRAAQYKAALNAAWMDRLVPLCAACGVALVLIGREYEDQEAGLFSTRDYKVGGGRSPYYDSSLVLRVVRDGWVKDGEGATAVVYGERARVEVHKTKVGGKDERVPEAYFHTSNGSLVPVGFDIARDLLEFAVDNGLVQQSGAYFYLGKRKLAQGKHATVKRLHDEPALLAALEEVVRAEVAEGVRRESDDVTAVPSASARPPGSAAASSDA